ncbi:MAG: response regulator [Lachnospiraceae bacterium]|nr:response regulator [Lachnospiraceae bacterium]
MKSIKKGGVVSAAIIGSVAVVAILIVGTMLTGRMAGSDTERAVRNVSHLYLDELAGRREQEVSTALNDYINDMDMAIGMLEKSDLESVESLQAYQTRMKQLYGLEKFAFVDENGIIYTSRGTRTDIDLYHFDHLSITEPEISLKNENSNDKKVIIAVPVDRLAFVGNTLVACFMEIDMDTFLSRLSFRSGNNNSTFCNLYTRDGTSLTDLVLGGLSADDNLLDALKKAEYAPGYSFETVKDEFERGAEGLVSFAYYGISETLNYVPVHGTDWMLTYLIRESVISEQMESISDGIIGRSLVLSITTALILIIISGIMITQMRKAVKLDSERETNELLKQELEERIALQDELLEQEKRRTQQDSMITALASDYSSVYYIDLDAGRGICYQNEKNIAGIGQDDEFDYVKEVTDYANRFVTEEYREAFLKFIEPESVREGLKKEKIITFRYMIRRNGEETYEMLRMAGVRHPEDREDNIVHAVGAGFTNIDAEMRDSLAKNQALSDALNSAEEASRAKTVFLSNMSHEIRTPMNAIIGLDSLALNEKDIPESTRNYLEKIGDSARHLLGLINDILDMSRIESGRVVIKNEEFSFSRMIEQINTMVSGQCEEKKLSYKCEMDGSFDSCYIGDQIKIKQVLINILGNAVKFTPEGGSIVFRVEKKASFDNKTTICFRISDTGVGMSKEYLPKLFNTFSQENEINTSKYGSSGLGMAITKNIVDMMNGKIEVDSEKGKGTTFAVTITLLNSDAGAVTEYDTAEITPHEIHVLVIDDDQIACDHARLVLEQAGVLAETALSGEKALDMIRLRHARQEPYNLIIIDWKMPGMDGVETTRAIRKEVGDESAIIILTAYNWDDIFEEATEAGVDSFVAKPLFISNLMDEFRSALKKKNASLHSERKPADLNGRRILLAEDMLINAEIMKEILKMNGMETDIAENGRIAVEMFESHEPGYYAAILMDMRMPEMTGLEATAAIRALGRQDAQRIPIIALTANAFDEDVQRSLQAGMNAHLSKPVEPEQLFKTLQELV